MDDLPPKKLSREEIAARMNELRPEHGHDVGFSYVTTNDKGAKLRIIIVPDEKTFDFGGHPTPDKTRHN